MDKSAILIIGYFIAVLLFARTLSAYSPSLVFQSTFDLKSKFLYYLLVDRSVTKRITKNKNKENKRNKNEQKITLAGVVFYVIILLAIIAALIILFVLPEGEAMDFSFSRYGHMVSIAYTENRFCVGLMCASLLGAELAAYLLNTIDVSHSYNRKFSKVFNIIMFVFCVLLSIGCICGMFSTLSDILYS